MRRSLVLLLVGALLVGCGGDDGSRGSTEPAPALGAVGRALLAVDTAAVRMDRTYVDVIDAERADDRAAYAATVGRYAEEAGALRAAVARTDVPELRAQLDAVAAAHERMAVALRQVERRTAEATLTEAARQRLERRVVLPAAQAIAEARQALVDAFGTALPAAEAERLRAEVQERRDRTAGPAE